MSGPVRVVSLVPSATETLLALGVTPIACTRFCEQPEIPTAEIPTAKIPTAKIPTAKIPTAKIPTVGGTKDPDVDAIVGLEPDLVVVNDEENRYEDAARLVDAGFVLHSVSPRSVADVGPAIGALADAIGAAVPAPFAPSEWEAWLDDRRATTPTPARAACTFVWRRPWTSMAGETYGASVLALCGLVNVFGAEADRYPVVSLEEAAMLGPEVAVLPSEPYPFAERHLAEVRAELPGVATVLVDGRDLFWWGVRTPDAIARLRLTIR